ncbi:MULTISPECIES: thioredoxin domain-containing protein [Acidithiobacillus]|uniref:Thiol:disulfide interchange protein DsbA n=1 Tax=Acidithiobacillus thiooxidans ATCC 19377 TaxID=637390 RepID=A0A543Q6H4_ACITH|nr:MULTISPECIES: thioredoxin domain-containing protein [Acidithiobacillus]MBU2740935.1 thioredoxin domain-containing protein [Acidithiobacillus albertensis]MDX5933864.1 thioredoxin domain-containing protein [Acidithiobacillus thiooxidans]TQN51918.1 Thiol:disulfide interchange protein DsbA [Acidithiobacillus thiooxidans ATCC 19377]
MSRKKIIAWCVGSALTLAGIPALASGLGGMSTMPTFKPYQRVHLGPQYQNTIIEAMVYECPFCRALNNQMLRWAHTLPGSLHFEQMPAVVGKPWITMAQSYFSVMAVNPGMLPRFDEEAFHLVQDDHYSYSNPRTYALAIEKIGISPSEYMAALRYKLVQNLVLKDMKIMAKAGIRRTPSLIICGRYVINPGSVQGNYSMFFQLANALASHCISENRIEADTP